MNLWDLNINDSGVVEKISTQNFDQLRSLGLSKNTSVRCLHKTLFNGPRVFEINGVVCTLCKQSATQVIVKTS